MPHLTDLAGNPLTWDELLRRNAEWHARYDEAIAAGWSVRRAAMYANGDFTGAVVAQS